MRNKFLHWWYSCGGFNRKYNHWQTDPNSEFPKCGICGNYGWWVYGWKSKPPDYEGIKKAGKPPTETTSYWAVHDGWIKNGMKRGNYPEPDDDNP